MKIAKTIRNPLCTIKLTALANGLSLLEIIFHRSNLIRIDANEKIAHIFRNFF